MTAEEQIKAYCEKKEEEKKLSSEIKKLGAGIKEFLGGLEDGKQVADGWVVRLQPKITEDMDYEKLVYILKEYWESIYGDIPCPYIRQVEVVNEEALESALYKGDIPEDIIDKIDGCRIKKKTVSLVYSRVKGE